METWRVIYFAGLMDGEAGFYINKRNKPFIRLNMTHEDTVRAAHEFFGVGSVRERTPSTRKPHWALQWEWVAWCRDAEVVARAVYPYLITRADACGAILAHYDKPVRLGRPPS